MRDDEPPEATEPMPNQKERYYKPRNFGKVVMMQMVRDGLERLRVLHRPHRAEHLRIGQRQSQGQGQGHVCMIEFVVRVTAQRGEEVGGGGDGAVEGGG